LWCGESNRYKLDSQRLFKGLYNPWRAVQGLRRRLDDLLDARNMRIPDNLNSLMREDRGWNIILIVDDDRDLNDLLKRWLEKNYPSNTRWYQSADFAAFSPWAWLNPATWFEIPSLQHKALRYEGQLTGVLTWKQTTLSADQIWLALPKMIRRIWLPNIFSVTCWSSSNQTAIFRWNTLLAEQPKAFKMPGSSSPVIWIGCSFWSSP